jgi:hypothetical protein
MLSRLAKLLTWIATLGIAGWGALMLWFSGPGPAFVRAALAIAVLLGLPAARALVRPHAKACLVVGTVFGVLLLWYFSIKPSNDRDWAPDVAHIPTAEIHGDLVTIHNVRNFDYRSETDFTERWETRTLDLGKVTGLDCFLSYWGSKVICHTILSWPFSDGQHLAVSIETRKERGEEYSAFKGFFRHYELCYVAADERDLVRLRTNYRHEQVYLYHLKTPAAHARDILVDYLAGMNALAANPEFYNALTTNCTTVIRQHALRVAEGPRPWTWKILANGYLDEAAYENGNVDTSLPFAELKAKCLIDAKAQAADQDPAFSQRIRRDLPGLSERGP